MKLYTTTGDDGTTGLFGGDRVAKTHPRIEAYGTVDEINACVGLAAAAISGVSASEARVHSMGRLEQMLTDVQSGLFDVGADLATPAGSKHEDKVRRIDAEDVSILERWIDEFADATPPIAVFVLPGGSELAARLHVARTVSRRAERAVVALGGSEEIVKWLNRLSDLFFAAARYANHSAGLPDVPWTKRG
jgi:cob(I)alamin adenosyltransferase